MKKLTPCAIKKNLTPHIVKTPVSTTVDYSEYKSAYASLQKNIIMLSLYEKHTLENTKELHDEMATSKVEIACMETAMPEGVPASLRRDMLSNNTAEWSLNVRAEFDKRVNETDVTDTPA